MAKYRLEPWFIEIELSLNPYEVLRAFDTYKHPVLLESGVNIENLGRYSIVAANPEFILRSKENECWIEKGNDCILQDNEGLRTLKKKLANYPSDFRGSLPFYGGVLGFFSYDLKDTLETLPCTTKHDLLVPDLWQGFYHWAYIYDMVEDKWWFVCSEWVESPENVYTQTLSHINTCADKVKDIHLPTRKSSPVFTPNIIYEDYLKSVEQVREYIRNGDIYQVNFTQRFHSTIECTPVELYGKLRKINPAPFAAYMDIGEYQIVSSSPERFISLREGKLETRPIKGTRPRGKTPEEDEFNKIELISSEKDQSELLMIVDLERNDIGKVSQTGSVKVTELFKLESYATVFHLVATVQGQLKEGLDITDCIRATFPGGSITGAPKIRAMEIIDKLEPTQRNLYTGSIGYIGFNGDADLNIVIRTVLCQNNDVWFHVGGGIVWDSDPQLEYEESLHKAKAQMMGISQ